ncbi:MAG: FkbM family methyltransferase [Clostridia bacterium]|nr:FkbM family methyltransferase [Clostridia bacterium]
MIEKIIKKNVWDTLKETPLPIILYGMGNGADMVIDELHKIGRDFDDIFAGDSFVRGQLFHGKRVKKYSEICAQYKDFFAVMCFAVHDDETIGFVKQIAAEHPFAAPNVPIVNDGVFTREYIEMHDEEFNAAFALLADEESRQNYINILNFKVSGKIDYLFKSEKNKREIYKDVLGINGSEVFVDLGAYNGDTIEEFIDAAGTYKKIFAFEADANNFKKLQKNTKNLKNIELFNLAAWNKKETLLFEKKKGRNSKLSSAGNVQIKADSVDSVINEPVTIIKMDIEGSEEKAILGAKDTIIKHKPKLYICAYHRNSDMFAIPLLINGICPDYRFYFYHQRYIPAWESNFFGIVK